jgi:hypothetical protein
VKVYSDFRFSGWLGWHMSEISATQESEIRRTVVRGQLQQKVTEAPSQQTSQAWWIVSVIVAVWRVQVGRSRSKAVSGKDLRPYGKTN